MQTVDAFITQLGGTVAVAVALGIAPTTVSSWKGSGSIPKWRMDGIREIAAEKGVSVPSEFARPTKAAA